jgi:hypothetical protein
MSSSLSSSVSIDLTPSSSSKFCYCAETFAVVAIHPDLGSGSGGRKN